MKNLLIATTALAVLAGSTEAHYECSDEENKVLEYADPKRRITVEQYEDSRRKLSKCESENDGHHQRNVACKWNRSASSIEPVCHELSLSDWREMKSSLELKRD